MGGSHEDIRYKWETTLPHNTCFIPRAILVTSLLPGCETRPHAETRSLFSGLAQWFLKEKGNNDLGFLSLNHQTSDEYAPQSLLLLKVSVLFQLCFQSFGTVFISYARVEINNSTTLKWMFKYTRLSLQNYIIPQNYCYILMQPQQRLILCLAFFLSQKQKITNWNWNFYKQEKRCILSKRSNACARHEIDSKLETMRLRITENSAGVGPPLHSIFSVKCAIYIRIT